MPQTHDSPLVTGMMLTPGEPGVHLKGSHLKWPHTFSESRKGTQTNIWESSALMDK